MNFFYTTLWKFKCYIKCKICLVAIFTKKPSLKNNSKFFCFYSTTECLEKNSEDIHTFYLKDNVLLFKGFFDWDYVFSENRSMSFEFHTLEFLWVRLIELQKSHNEEVYRVCRDVVLDWIAYNNSKKFNDGTFAWYDMAVALIAPIVTYVYAFGTHYSLLTSSEERILFKSIKKHFKYLLNDKYYAFNHNHGIFSDIGLLSSLLFFPNIKVKNLILKRLEYTCKNTIEISEAIHLEHSPAYHVLISNTLLNFFDIFDRNHYLYNVAESMSANASYMVDPLGNIAMVGDSDNQHLKIKESNSVFQKCFIKSGYFSYKNSKELFLIFSAYHNPNHKHVDDTSFIFSDSVGGLITDTGKHSYIYDHPYRKFSTSNLAHNVLIVDRHIFDESDLKNHKPWGSTIDESFQKNGFYFIICNNNWLKELGVNSKRLFVFKPNGYIVIFDFVLSIDSHVYDRIFHVSPDFGAHEINSTGIIFKNKSRNFNITDISIDEEKSDIIVVEGDEHSFYKGFQFNNQFDIVTRKVAVLSKEINGESVIITKLGINGSNLDGDVSVCRGSKVNNYVLTCDNKITFNISYANSLVVECSN